MQLLNFLFFPHSLPLTKVSHSLLYSLRTPIPLPHCINVHLFSARMHCSHLSTMLFPNASHQYASPHFIYLHYAMHIITKWGDAHYALPTLYPPTIQNPHFASDPQIFLLKISQLCICSLCISSLGISSLCTSPHYASPLTMHLPTMHLGRTQVCNMHISVCISERHKAKELNTNLKELKIVRLQTIIADELEMYKMQP